MLKQMPAGQHGQLCDDCTVPAVAGSNMRGELASKCVAAQMIEQLVCRVQAS